MNSQSPDTAALFGDPTSMTVESGAGNITVLFPDVGNTRRHVQRILTGLDYSVLPIAGYTADTIVDIGANIGGFALYMNQQFPDARCVCFEPSPGAFNYLAENTKDIPNITAHHLGLFSQDSEMTLFDGASQGLQSSLYASAETSQSGTTVTLRHAERALEEFGPKHISILKVDKEGAEMPILLTLAGRLGGVDQVYLEYHSEQDRREIDTLLGETHVLAGASAKAAHRGTNHYLNKALLEAYPDLNVLKIART